MRLGDRDHIVEIDGALIFHAILFRQEDLGGHTTDGGGDRCQCDRG